MRELKWLQLDNAFDTATLKQHAFIPKIRKRRFTHEEYIGNISLCGRIVCGNEDEEIERFDLIESEPLNTVKACKTCLKLSYL